MGMWRTNGIEVGDLVKLDEGEFNQRVGHCWAQGRLRAGDVLVATGHAGDCFFNWLLLKASPNAMKDATTLHLEPVPAPFGAYTLGRNIGSVTSHELAELVSGESVTIAMPERFQTPARDRTEDREFATFRQLGEIIAEMPVAMLDGKVELADDSGRFHIGGTVSLAHPHGKAEIIPND